MQIKNLKIYSSNLSAQKVFYKEILGLNILHETEDSISIHIGKSILIIQQKDKSTPYHFAINIPANQEQEALLWLKSKVDILQDGDNEIQDFDFWNAKAIYFYDADNNIVEFIVRKNLDNNSNKPFDNNSLLEISEIGMPTLDIEAHFKVLNENLGLEVFSGAFDRFCAIGGETGLFICINREKRDWYPKQDTAFSSDFELLWENGTQSHQIIYQQDKLTIL